MSLKLYPSTQFNNTKDSNYIIGSAEALPLFCVTCARREREREIQRERDGSEREIQREREREREKERERDGSDVTIGALKLAMSLHFSCQKTVQLR